jgi:hypothetical protein
MHPLRSCMDAIEFRNHGTESTCTSAVAKAIHQEALVISQIKHKLLTALIENIFVYA